MPIASVVKQQLFAILEIAPLIMTKHSQLSGVSPPPSFLFAMPMVKGSIKCLKKTEKRTKRKITAFHLTQA